MAEAQEAAGLFFMSPQGAWLYVLLLSVLLLLLVQYLAARGGGHGRGRGRLPPSPPGLPLIGHLHLVTANPHISFADLHKKHGTDGLLTLYLGHVRNIIVSSPRAAEAVLRTHDHLFSSRPQSGVADVILSGHSDVAFSPYGDYWRQAKRLVTTHMLSAKKVASFRGAREEETRIVVAKIGEAAAARAAIDISELVKSFTNDIVCRAVSGKLFRGAGRNKLCRELVEANMVMFAGFNVEDYYPSLAKVSLLTRVVLAKANRLKKRWDDLLDEVIDEHARETSLHGHGDDDQERDFIDVLLSFEQEYNLTREHIKAILMDMFVAGIDTSSNVMDFAMAELIRKPHLMAKLQDEIRKKTPGNQETVTETDISGMTYLKAVIKETLRLHAPAPLLLPRVCIADCNDLMDGYMIPAGSRVMVNVWAIGRDRDTWGDDADEFRPERFTETAAAGETTTASVNDFKGSDYKFLPFGSGRRICPGVTFGVASVEIMLANLLYCFDWELPAGERREDVSMEYFFGLAMRRKEKLCLVPTPRQRDFNAQA